MYVCAHSGCDDGAVLAKFTQKMGRSGPNSRGNVRAEFLSQSAPDDSACIYPSGNDWLPGGFGTILIGQRHVYDCTYTHHENVCVFSGQRVVLQETSIDRMA